MNCEQANQVDLVDYLNSVGYQPKKTKGHDYLYLSPFRDEKDASFKVDRNKNVWYDHGIGKGGKLVDFLTELHHCTVSEALQKISFFQPQNNLQINNGRPQFHLQENSLLDHRDARETAIKIIAANQPIEDLQLCRYLKQRRIEKTIAHKYCFEVMYCAMKYFKGSS